MANKKIVQESISGENAKFMEDISSLKKSINKYKIDRKADWKEFKTNVKNEIKTIKKSINNLTINNK